MRWLSAEEGGDETFMDALRAHINTSEPKAES